MPLLPALTSRLVSRCSSLPELVWLVWLARGRLLELARAVRLRDPLEDDFDFALALGIVIASVDTYLRFAEAVNRLDLAESGGQGLPEIMENMTEGGAESKTKGVLEGAKQKLFGSGDDDDDDDDKSSSSASKSSSARSSKGSGSSSGSGSGSGSRSRSSSGGSSRGRSSSS